jgi:hypothetical protein
VGARELPRELNTGGGGWGAGGGRTRQYSRGWEGEEEAWVRLPDGRVLSAQEVLGTSVCGLKLLVYAALSF